jgi:hypothetical protein
MNQKVMGRWWLVKSGIGMAAGLISFESIARKMSNGIDDNNVAKILLYHLTTAQ